MDTRLFVTVFAALGAAFGVLLLLWAALVVLTNGWSDPVAWIIGVACVVLAGVGALAFAVRGLGR